ncbi:penicillin acylase family protein [Acuticoccus sp. MNP-M23]|uniref:penicillin acylase family protein n=1 Tax=Acuticoccus sp. MNP-M23 TaxID=3072793 RepID=UPI002814DFEC|nr:penicillin acylase family protein [Acuticoccus sp. MNP-M23]WMS43693.1 penicillin acylase family protein [Acuticoccus sp. MNP-M23]
MATRTRQAFSLAGLAASVVRRTVARPFPELDLEGRLASLPQAAHTLKEPIDIRWNAQHVPMVQAKSMRDAAVGLGMVHGHLRLAQMEVMRRAAFGIVSEVAGKAALELDQLLRLLDFPRATEASLAMMPAETRDWIDGFAEGITTIAFETPPPPEFEIFGIRPSPFIAEDLFAISRLCSADYSWKVWRTLNALRQEDDWAEMWADLIGVAAVADEDIPYGAEQLDEMLPTAFTRGSNCYAVDGTRTATGKPMLACDPHLMIATPQPWLIAGFEVPDLTVWGLMVPALPIFGAGRNGHGAWGGTNLHATSSELVNVADEDVETEEIIIPLRGKRRVKRKHRQSTLGPIISDAKPFRMPAETVALHWLGHRPSDEYTPFLDLMRAENWDQFESAVDGYALPGLNMLWAGNEGGIGKMIGAHVPRRPLATPKDMVVSRKVAEDHWRDLVTGRDLPKVVNPACGFISSANEEPKDPEVTISLFFSAPTRVERIAALIGDRQDLTLQDFRTFHADVYLAPAHTLASALAVVARDVRPDARVTAALADWDGRYEASSAGALAFELVAKPLIDSLDFVSEKRRATPYWRPFARLTNLTDHATPEELATALAKAIDSAEPLLERHRTWGRIHRLRLAHPLTKLPWVGSRLPTIDLPTGGSNDTLMKSMHPFTQKVHGTNFAANARFLADLSDPDETYACLLGGQDGWPGSRTMFDMVGPWRRSDYVRLPMTAAGLDADFAHVTRIETGAPDA